SCRATSERACAAPRRSRSTRWTAPTLGPRDASASPPFERGLRPRDPVLGRVRHEAVEEARQASHHGLAVDLRDHLAPEVHDDGVGRSLEAEAVRDREPRVERDGVGDLLLADEALHVRGGVLDVERQDLDAARAVALRQAPQRRRLLRAWLAPRRLEGHDEDLLADQLARVECALAAEE